MGLFDITRAVIRRIASHRKVTWDLPDYPVRVTSQEVGPGATEERFRPIPWFAQIINWWQMTGHGNTREEALENLRLNFDNYRRSHDRLPRPGTRVPLQFAASSRIDQHPALARDFMSRILSLNLDECFVSDESSLWDFSSDLTNDAYYKKILLLYGVDVSDVEGARLSAIFERIAAHRRAG